MKRTLFLLAAVAVAVTPAAGNAAPKPPKKTVRTVTFAYNGPCGVHASSVGSVNLSAVGCETGHTQITATKAEKYVTFSVTDSNGTPIGIQYWVNGAYNPGAMYTCSKGTAKNKKGGGTYDFNISVSPDCQGLPTSGTLTVKLSNLP